MQCRRLVRVSIVAKLTVIAMTFMIGTVAVAQEADRTMPRQPIGVATEIKGEVPDRPGDRGIVAIATIRLPADLFTMPQDDPIVIQLDDNTTVALQESRRNAISTDKTLVVGVDEGRAHSRFLI